MTAGNEPRSAVSAPERTCAAPGCQARFVPLDETAAYCGKTCAHRAKRHRRAAAPAPEPERAAPARPRPPGRPARPAEWPVPPRPVLVAEHAQVVTGPGAGECGACGRPMRAGDRVARLTDGETWIHAACAGRLTAAGPNSVPDTTGQDA